MTGMTPQELTEYIEKHSNWQNTFGWDENNGRNNWELDHIFPMAKWDFLKHKYGKTDREVHEMICHWSNLQPLSKQDNQSKSDKIPRNFCWNGNQWFWKNDNHEDYLSKAEEDNVCRNDNKLI